LTGQSLTEDRHHDRLGVATPSRDDGRIMLERTAHKAAELPQHSADAGKPRQTTTRHDRRLGFDGPVGRGVRLTATPPGRSNK